MSTPETAPPPPAESAERTRFRLPLAAVLATVFGGLVALAVAVVLAISYLAGRDGTIELLRAREELTVSVLEIRVHEALAPAAEQLGVIATILERNTAVSYGRLRLADLLSGALAPGRIGEISFADPAGVEIEVTPGIDGAIGIRIQDHSSDPALREAINEASGRAGGWWEGIGYDGGEPAMVRRQSVWRDGKFFGLLTARVSLRALSAAVERVPGVPGGSAGGGFVLLGRDRVIGHAKLVSEWQRLQQGRALPRLAEFDDVHLAGIWNAPDTEATGAGGLQVRIVPFVDDRYVFSLRTFYSFGPEPLIVGHYRPARELGAELNRIQLAGLAGLVVLGLAVIAAVLIGRGMSRPTKRLAEAANQLRAFRFAEMKRLPGSVIAEIDDEARAFNDMLTALRWFESYVPKALVRRLVRRADGGDYPSVERELTIFFSDIAGYTAMSQRLNAAEAAQLLNRHIALVAAAIDATGGTVDKFIGDAVMAFWGAPKRQEDHAERAVRAALAAAQAIGADNAERRAAGLPPLRVRIGLHTGRVVVGNIGAPGRVNYTIIGDAVNIAERLQELGKEIGRPEDDVTILLSRATAERLPPGLPVEPAGGFSLRGRAGTVEVFRAVPPSPVASPAPAMHAAAP